MTWRWLPLLLVVGGCGSTMQRQEQQYRQNRAAGHVAAYEQARLKGDRLDMCVKANAVAGAYRDAGQEGDAGAWDARRNADCRAAYAALAPAPDAPERP